MTQHGGWPKCRRPGGRVAAPVSASVRLSSAKGLDAGTSEIVSDHIFAQDPNPKLLVELLTNGRRVAEGVRCYSVRLSKPA
jgi:hypothetical protein